MSEGEGERQRAGGRGSEGEGERQRAGGRGSEGEGERQRAGGRGSDLRETITDALREVYDPCCADRGLSIVDMGLIDDICVDDDGQATVELVLTSGWCPFVVPLLDTIKDRLAQLDVGRDTDVRVVWDRVWSSARLSQVARERLQFLPPPSQLAGGGAATAPPPVQPTIQEVRP